MIAMRERAQMVGGILQIQESNNSGTLVTLKGQPSRSISETPIVWRKSPVKEVAE